MKNTPILLTIDPDTPGRVITNLANSAFEDQTHLNCLLLGAAPTLPVYAYGTPPYAGRNIPDDWG